MKIGTLIIWIFVVPAWILRIDKLQEIMDPLLRSVSEKYDFDYRRFEYSSANLNWVVHLKEFWKNDRIFTTLHDYLVKNFSFFQLSITLTSEEKGG